MAGPKFSSFNPFPSLPSVATNDRKKNKRHNIVLNNKPGPLFLEFIWQQDIFGILKKMLKLSDIAPLKPRSNSHREPKIG